MKVFKILLPVFVLATLTLPCSAAPSFRMLQLNIWQEGTSVPDGNAKIADAILKSQADVVAFSEVRNYKGEDWHTKILAALKAKAPETKFYGQYVAGDTGLISRFPIASTAKVCGSIMAYRLTRPDGHEFTVCSAHLDYTSYGLNLVRGYNGGNPDWNIIDENKDGIPDRITDVQKILQYNRESQRDEAVSAFLAFAEDERVAGRAVVLAGDFNEGSHLDWTEKAKNFAGHYGVVIPWDNSLALAKAGFRDTWRVVYPDEVAYPGFTWPATAFEKKTTSWAPLSDERDRIDFVYATPDLRPVNAWIVGPKTSFIGEQKVDDPGPTPFIGNDLPWPSDHKGVLVELAY